MRIETMTGKTTLKRTILLAGFALLFASSTRAQGAGRLDEGVILADVIYSDGAWVGSGSTILPCPGQSKASRSVANPAAIRTLDADGRVLFERHFPNPRIDLVERGQPNPGLRKQLDFVLKAPFSKGVSAVEFWESLNQEKASLRIDLSAEAARYQKAGGFAQEASCKPPGWKLGKRASREPSTPSDPGDQKATLAGLQSLLEADPEALVRLARAADVTPQQVEELLAKIDEEALRRWGISRTEANERLRAFTKAYEASEKD